MRDGWKQVYLWGVVLIILLVACSPDNSNDPLPTLAVIPTETTLTDTDKPVVGFVNSEVIPTELPDFGIPFQPNEDEQTWTVNDGGAPLYICASDDCDIVGNIGAGVEVRPSAYSDEWLDLLPEGKAGGYIKLSDTVTN